MPVPIGTVAGLLQALERSAVGGQDDLPRGNSSGGTYDRTKLSERRRGLCHDTCWRAVCNMYADRQSCDVGINCRAAASTKAEMVFGASSRNFCTRISKISAANREGSRHVSSSRLGDGLRPGSTCDAND